MRLVGRLLLVDRAFARILNRKSRRNDEKLPEGVLFRTGEEHAAELRVDRKARERLPHLGEFPRIRDGAELLKNRVAVGNRLRACTKGNSRMSPR